jgi:hypothetical protein
MDSLPPPRILVIDDDADTRANLCDILELDGYTAETAGSAQEALHRESWPHLTAILLDRKLPDSNAEALLPQLQQRAPQAAILIITGQADLEGAISALRAGAADYILKPINADLIRSRLAGVVERQRAAQEIVRLNKKLQHRLRELQTLLDVVPVGIAFAQDVGCQTIRINKTLGRWLRLEPDITAIQPATDVPYYKLCRGGRELSSTELPVQLAAQGQEVRDQEMEVLHPDGELLHLLCQAAPLLDDQGQSRGAIAAFLDITERKRAQERLLQTERLAAIGQMMTGLAHESGNALARSRACLEMLTWEVQDRPEAMDLIGRIQKAQDHLQHLYEEVRGYAAPLRLDREILSVASVWRQAWENLALARHGRWATLHEEVGDLDPQCAIDAFRLEQVFRNIFENALAACPDPVQVRVRCTAAVLEGKPALCVSVRDNGPGLTPEQRQRIFDPFYTTKTKGTGLGMAIAKRIVEAHGGRIATGAGTQPGAEIVLTLPREVP